MRKAYDRAFPAAGVAQSVEHVLGKDGVTGSIPVSSLIFLKYARNNYFRVHGLQKQKLHYDKE